MDLVFLMVRVLRSPAKGPLGKGWGEQKRKWEGEQRGLRWKEGICSRPEGCEKCSGIHGRGFEVRSVSRVVFPLLSSAAQVQVCSKVGALPGKYERDRDVWGRAWCLQRSATWQNSAGA